MCGGGIDLKHLARETESRLAGWPQVDATHAARPGVFARLRGAFAALRMRLRTRRAQVARE